MSKRQHPHSTPQTLAALPLPLPRCPMVLWADDLDAAFSAEHSVATSSQWSHLVSVALGPLRSFCIHHRTVHQLEDERRVKPQLIHAMTLCYLSRKNYEIFKKMDRTGKYPTDEVTQDRKYKHWIVFLMQIIASNLWLPCVSWSVYL